MFGLGNFDPNYFLGFMIGFVAGTALHEFMHAYTALMLGDTTAQRQGRVTLNPIAHFDPFGFAMGVLLALGVGFLAWGRPVPVNPYALRGGRRGMALVAVAGPLSNLAIAAALSPLYRFGTSFIQGDARQILGNIILINILLFCFNLIPIPPLDGFNILSGVLPNPWVTIFEPLRRNSLPILIGLVFFVPLIGQTIGISLSPVTEALLPIIRVVRTALVGT